ncbi:Vac17 protein [Maudiozyma humilis]|uniref:Vac17 protein n=1 Tax=Maudiozyma humilis TaxID=51915 RepID=A0AAV5RYD1_MAUHU|nr:Vac17 protein [Kazachstania humilis]
MSSLADIADKLLIRSQESILQLDLWIKQRERAAELRGEVWSEQESDLGTLYVAQLNSLHIRSKYIRDKLLESGNTGPAGSLGSLGPIGNPEEYIKQLVFEYRDITVKLNETILANKHANSNHTSPSSQTTGSSHDSFEPKPLKIYSRQRDSLLLFAEGCASGDAGDSPTKKRSSGAFNTNVGVIPPLMESFALPKDTFRTLAMYKSLPSSPMKKRNTTTHTSVAGTGRDSQPASPVRPLRSAKSYGDNLNGSNRQRKHSAEYDQVFKQKNRLSLSLVPDDESSGFREDSAEPTSTNITAQEMYDESDQDTIMQYTNSPVCNNKVQFEPLRRYNSHESILSTRNSMLLERKSKPLRFSPFMGSGYQFHGATAGSVQVNNSPIFADSVTTNVIAQPQPARKMRSTDLLHSVMKGMAPAPQPSAQTNVHAKPIPAPAPAPKSKSKPKSKQSFFDSWNVFNKYPMTLTSETGRSEYQDIMHGICNGRNIQTFRKQVSPDTIVISTVISTKPKGMVPNATTTDKFSKSYDSHWNGDCENLIPTDDYGKPHLASHKTVQFSDLQEALDTELLL